jgi:hypothetical protein
VTDADDTPEKSPAEQAIEQALDVFVYAPIGLLFEGASLLPTLVEKGKTQVTMARMIGQFAVGQGRTEAGKKADDLRNQAADLLARFAEVKLPGQGASVPRPPPRRLLLRRPTPRTPRRRWSTQGRRCPSTIWPSPTTTGSRPPTW